MQFIFSLSFEITDDSKHLPLLKQKSKIPVRVSTRVSSDSDKTSSSENETDKKPSVFIVFFFKNSAKNAI